MFTNNNQSSASQLLSKLVKTEEELDVNPNLRQRGHKTFSTEMVPIPRFEKQPTVPAVYKIKIKNDHHNATFSLVKDFDRLPEPTTRFGDLNKIVNRTWHTYMEIKKRGRKHAKNSVHRKRIYGGLYGRLSQRYYARRRPHAY